MIEVDQARPFELDLRDFDFELLDRLDPAERAEHDGASWKFQIAQQPDLDPAKAARLEREAEVEMDRLINLASERREQQRNAQGPARIIAFPTRGARQRQPRPRAPRPRAPRPPSAAAGRASATDPTTPTNLHRHDFLMGKGLSQGITKVGTRQFRIRVRGEDPRTGKLKEVDRVASDISIHDARRLREEYRAELRAGIVKEAPERMTLAAFAHSWLESRAPKLKRSTAEHYAAILDDHILPYLGDLFVDAIQREDLERWSKSQSAVTQSDETVRSRFRVLRTVMRQAARRNGFPVPSDGVELYLPGGALKEKESLLPRELWSLLEVVREQAPEQYALVLALALTGSKWGEVTALKWDDIDEEAGVITFCRAHHNQTVSSTKTKVSTRAMPLHPLLKEALREHRQRLLANQHPGLAEGWAFATRSKADPSKAVLRFPSSLQKALPRFPSSLQKALPKWLEAAGICKHITPHSFRRANVDLHRWARTDPEVARSMVGHATATMTSHYSTVVGEEQSRAMDNVVDLLQGKKVSGGSGG